MPLTDELRAPSIEQVMRNHIKVARAAIRLRHSIQADNELAAMIPALKLGLELQAQNGSLTGMTTAEMLALVEGDE